MALDDDDGDNATVRLGIGLLVLGIAFVLGWMDASAGGVASCSIPTTQDAGDREQGQGQGQGGEKASNDCSAFAVLFTMLFAIFQTAVRIVLLVIIVLSFEMVIVPVVAMPDGRNAAVQETVKRSGRQEMASLAALFAWAKDRLMVTAIVASVLTSGLFAMLYMGWLRLQGADPARMRRAVRDIYVFQLVSFFGFVVFQFVLGKFVLGVSA